jgi:hypothetical protein
MNPDVSVSRHGKGNARMFFVRRVESASEAHPGGMLFLSVIAARPSAFTYVTG